jgi:SAM-dependent methyltransferase
MTATPASIDAAEAEQFTGHIVSILSGSMLSYMIDLGDRTGLFAAAASGPATSTELAGRAGMQERYVREWLGAMVTGGIFDFDATTETYALPREHALVLTDGPANLAPMARLNTHLGKHVHQVARAFREGGGVPYAAFRPEFTEVMDAISRGIFDAFLLDAYVPLVPEFAARLQGGIRVADVACGAGHALVVLGRAYPSSSFVGFDSDEHAIARARAEAAGAGLDNVTFEVCDAATLVVDDPFDAVLVFDALHDQVDPVAVLDRIHAALASGGFLLLKEPHAGDSLEANRDNPMASLLYSVSTLHCLTVSLAHDGAGIGTMFSESLARRLLADAGFIGTEVFEAPGDPADAIFVARKRASS